MSDRAIQISYVLIDTSSDTSIISENVAALLDHEIDQKNFYALKGVASRSITLGTIYAVLITISDGKNSVTVTDDLSVVPAERGRNGKDVSLLILGTPWQYRAGWKPVVKGEFEANVNGKSVAIPLSVHKSSRNIFKVESTSPIKKTS